jgi:hypothetical protein
MAGEARLALLLVVVACTHQRMPDARPIVGSESEAEPRLVRADAGAGTPGLVDCASAQLGWEVAGSFA